MEAALYDPEYGYYARRAAIGDGGDFVTSPAISPLFARAIARTFARDAATFEGEMFFCEAASGSGTFLRDFRASLAELDPEASARRRLWAIERSGAGRDAIAGAGVAERIAGDVADLAGASFDGWVFSNELYDALPVHASGGRRSSSAACLAPGSACDRAKSRKPDSRARSASGSPGPDRGDQPPPAAAAPGRGAPRRAARSSVRPAIALDLYHSDAPRSGTRVALGGRRGGPLVGRARSLSAPPRLGTIWRRAEGKGS
jgi:hypothetical protein